jgi:hypothetical protein
MRTTNVCGCALPANAESVLACGETVSSGEGARIVNSTGTLTVSPGDCIDVKAIVSWWTTWDNVSARSFTIVLSGAPPELDTRVSHEDFAAARQERIAPSALASRSIVLTGTLEPALAEATREVGLMISRS